MKSPQGERPRGQRGPCLRLFSPSLRQFHLILVSWPRDPSWRVFPWAQLSPVGGAGRCQEGVCRAWEGKGLTFLPSSLSAAFLVGLTAVFPAAAGPGWAGQGRMCKAPAHVPSVTLFAGVSQLLATCKRAVMRLLWDVEAPRTDRTCLSIRDVLYASGGL